MDVIRRSKIGNDIVTIQKDISIVLRYYRRNLPTLVYKKIKARKEKEVRGISVFFETFNAMVFVSDLKENEPTTVLRYDEIEYIKLKDKHDEILICEKGGRLLLENQFFMGSGI